MSEKTVKLTDESNGHGSTLPLVEPSMGPACIDIASLYKDTGHYTYDPGFAATASTKSAITYIDGDKGVLLYRGYPIEQLAEKSSFLEVSYLLLNGELPDANEFKAFQDQVTHHTMMHESLKYFLRGFRYDAHPMAMLCGSIASLSAFYHEDLDIDDPAQRKLAAVRLIAKMPTIAAACYRYSISWPVRYPRNNLEYVDRFLHMMFEVPSEPLNLNPVVAKALDLLFILHADHEQNASTSTVRIAGSSGANPFACIAAGIACLWGPAHGGANEAALAMLSDIGTVDKIPDFITKVKDLSAYAVITTGSTSPGSMPCVWALNALQNSMMLRPRWPSAGPIGGEGFALPAGTCSLMKPTTFFAICSFLLSSSSALQTGSAQLLVQRPGPCDARETPGGARLPPRNQT